MKTLFTAGLMACTLALAGCAVPEVPATAADARQAEMAKDLQDDGVLLTGSRIPQKSTSHSMKRVGSKDYKKAAGEAGQHNPASPTGGQ